MTNYHYTASQENFVKAGEKSIAKDDCITDCIIQTNYIMTEEINAVEYTCHRWNSGQPTYMLKIFITNW